MRTCKSNYIEPRQGWLLISLRCSQALVVGALVLGIFVIPASVTFAVDCAFDHSNSDIYGYRFTIQTFESICAGPPDVRFRQPDIVARPGRYTVTASSIDGRTKSWTVTATRPGVYRFFAPGIGGSQFVVWWPALGIPSLMSFIGATYTHGNRDDNLSIADLRRVITNRRISVTCGTISRLLNNILSDLGSESRLAYSITTRSKNGLDDGHIMLEVWEASKWVLYDPDSRTMFGTKQRPLSVADLDSDFRPNVYKNVTPLGPPLTLDHFGFVDSSGVDLSFLEERSRVSAKALGKWYRRVLGRVGVEMGGSVLFARSREPRVDTLVLSSFPAAKFVPLVELKRGP